MYFTSKGFSHYYKLLNTVKETGKTNLERTSSLVYFLAQDKLQKKYSVDTIDVSSNSDLRKEFQNAVKEILAVDTKTNEEVQANHLGVLNIEDSKNSIFIKTGKNFLSTQVYRASTSAETFDYPTRPKNSPILKLGVEYNGSKNTISKHKDWQNNLLTYIDFRKCGQNTLPLIIFLLRDSRLEKDMSMKPWVEKELKEIFTEDLSEFLLENAAFPEKMEPSFIGTEKWSIDKLDTDLFKNIENEEKKPYTNVNSSKQNIYPAVKIQLDIPRNKIVYGAPGTGKSYSLNEEVIELFKHEELLSRITFHPDYTYSQFIGTYKPVPLYKKTNNEIYKADKTEVLQESLEPVIDYQFVPGPFLETLVKSYKYPDSSFIIIIEEINRANTASVFGDTFQLLDRNKNAESEYGITFNADIMNFLRSQGIYETKIKIPSNLFIWATMNSSDQGVIPMDTAFKRRWSFEYLPLNKNEEAMDDYDIYLSFIKDKKVPWNKFRKTINDRIKDFVPEDKLIGPFFLKPNELTDPDSFKNKLLLYLRDDVLRYNYDKLFLKKNFSDIIEDYDNGYNIFTFPEEELSSEQ